MYLTGSTTDIRPTITFNQVIAFFGDNQAWDHTRRDHRGAYDRRGYHDHRSPCGRRGSRGRRDREH